MCRQNFLALENEKRLCAYAPHESLQTVNAYVLPLWILGISQKFSPSAEKLKELSDPVKWIKVFGDVKNFGAKPDPSKLNNANYTVDDVFLALSADERKLVFMEYVNHYFPPALRIKNGISVDSDPLINAQKILVNQGEFKIVNEAFTVVFNDPKLQTVSSTPVAGKLAVGSLEEIYGMEKFRQYERLKSEGKVPKNSLNQYALKSLVDDYKATLTGVSLRNFGTATSPNVLINSEYAPDTFRAALRLGVIQQSDLKALQTDGLERLAAMNTDVHSKVSQNLDALTQSSKAERQRDAVGIRDLFNDMGGIEKLALLGVAGYGLTTQIGRGLLGTMTFLYFGQKFLLKDADPLETWSGLLTKGLNFSNKLGPDALGGVADPQKKVALMLNFLKEYDPAGYKTLEMQATGFGLMADTKMSDISRNFIFHGDGTLSLNTAGLRPILNKVKQDSGWTGNIDAFFRDSKSVAELTGGLSFVFYKIAAKDPAHFDKVQRLESALRLLPANMAIADLPCDQDLFSEPQRTAAEDANQAYLDLVSAGHASSFDDPRTLSAVIPLLTQGPQKNPRKAPTLQRINPSTNPAQPTNPTANPATNPAQPTNPTANPASNPI